MKTTPDITLQQAVKLLGFSNKASLMDIGKRYHELVREWHPDVSEHEPDESHMMMIRYKEAYEILVDYCMNYQVTFTDEGDNKRHISRSIEYWKEHFGEEPIWG